MGVRLSTQPSGTAPAPSADRVRDPQRTRAEILDVATSEFAANGYAGARVDEIAAKTRTTKRMIYYYFESKQGLYLAVLEQAYSVIRSLERQVDVEHLDPLAALRELAELTFDHHESHPDFIRLVSIENIHGARHLAQSAMLPSLSAPVPELIGRILERGWAADVLREDVDALDVHMLISSYCVFRIANRHTWSTIFGRDMLDPGRREHYRTMLGDMVVDYLSKR
jgi:AcrR family transcriptional regulator